MKISGVKVAGLSLVLVSMLSSCGGRNDIDEHINNAAFSNKVARQCLSELKSNKVNYAALPNKSYGGGCRANDAVTLIDIGTPVSNLGPMTCTLAGSFTDWAREIVRPAAKKHLGSVLARIETSGTYSCRRVGGNGKLSQHAFANAVDVFAFVTEDGQRITVLGGWNGTRQQQAFLRELHSAACDRFGTVLGPGYNQEHANHFHLDMAPSRSGTNSFCR